MSLSAPLTCIRQQWQRLTTHHGRAGAVLLLVLAALLVGSVVYTLEAETPWGKTVQKRLAKGRELDVREYRIIGLWWASLASAAGAALLLGTHRFWLPGKTDKLPSQRAGAPTWFWAAVLGITLIGAWERAPRLHHSLWNDEEYSLRVYSHGEWVQKDGATTFKPASWEKTLFDNGHGNNHVFTAAAARVSLDIWRAFTGAPAGAFDEAALRMPSFLSSLVTIIIVGWLGFQMGGPAVGLAAAALLAISPWHIRFSTESKGYSTMLAFMAVNLVAATLASRDGRLRWWLLFAGAEAGYLLCFAGSLYVAAAVNLFLAAEFLIAGRHREILKLVGFNLLGAIPVIWWMSPSVPQVLSYLNDPNSPRLDMGWPWLRDLLSGWAIGWGHTNPFPELHTGTSWVMEMSHAGWPFKILMLGILPLLALLGFIAACRRPAARHLGVFAIIGATAITVAGALAYIHTGTSWELAIAHAGWPFKILMFGILPLLALLGFIGTCRRPISRYLGVTAITVAGALAYTHSALKHQPMWVWYLIYTVIPMVLVLPLGVQLLARRQPRLEAGLLAVLVGTFAWATWDSTAKIREHDRQPIRETVEYVRTQAPRALTGTFGVSDRQAESYDHNVQVLKTPTELDALIKDAQTRAVPLYIYLCGESVTAPRHPEMFQRVKQSGEFEMLTHLPGTEEMFGYHVYRLKSDELGIRN